MDIRKVKKLIERLEESNLNEIEIKEGEEAVKLVKSNPIPGNFISSTPAVISEPTQQSPITKPSAPSSEVTVTQEISQTSDVLESGNKMNSPMVGTFYSAPTPEDEPFVSKGDIVKKGQVVAKMGSSGRSTGPHVHFEVHKNGRTVDPSSYINRTIR